MIIILRIVATLLAALLGIIGIIKDLKDKNTRKPNRWGYIALSVIAVSALVAVVSDFVETVQERDEARRILRDLHRNLHRIEDVGFEFKVRVPMGHPALATYRERIFPAVRAIMSSADDKGSYSQELLSVPFISKSPLLPDLRRERVAYTFLSHVCMGLELFADPAKAEAFTLEAGNSQGAGDLVFLLTRSAGQTEKNDVFLGIDISSERFSLSGVNAKVGPPQKSTGTIVSIPDLAGATAVIYFCPKGYQDAEERRQFRSVASDIEVIMFGLNLSGGRRMNFRPENHENRHGEQVYVFKFPKTVEEVEGLVKK